MSADWVTAIATAGTFLVIAASAAAALVQLRHLRNSNQIVILGNLRAKMESPDFRNAVKFILEELPERMKDSGFRRELLAGKSREAQTINVVALFFDFEASQLVKHGMLDEKFGCDLLYYPAVACWDALAPLIASRRAVVGYRQWEDFEYLALLCKRFRAKFPAGTYPRGAESLPLPDPWPETAEYAKS